MAVRTDHRAQKTRLDPRWNAVVTRDAQADGEFYYSVKTTGVYCRPSCAARQAKPENVQFHRTRQEAERAGFRPCKRCMPEQPSLKEKHVRAVTNVCKLIETSETFPTLEELANHAGLSPYYFHRLFRKITGLTPKAYATARRADRIRKELQKTKTITDAIYNAGYNSNGRFYETTKQVLGMAPENYRKGGVNIDICYATSECSLGFILVACSEYGVCAIYIDDDPDKLVSELQGSFPRAGLTEGDSSFIKLVEKVVRFVEEPAIGLDLPLDIRGTAFQQRVWQALCEIPAGKTASYAEVANRIGSPKSVRAVAQACASNKLAVAIPCHRVIRNDGKLSGYRWGVERKRTLLEREKRKQKD